MDSNKLELHLKGYTLFSNYFETNFSQKVNSSIDESYKFCREIQVKNGLGAITDGTLHHLLATNDPIYTEILNRICDSEIYSFIKEFFSGNFILNSYGGVKNLPAKPSYVANIHRDIRFFSGDFPLMLNLLIMLDDFTLDNGATYMLSGSHLEDRKPTEEEFYKKSARATGKRGDILFFNSNLWHAAGINNTNEERRAITITFTKPFLKQQLDYSRAVGYENIEKLSPKLQQILGFFSRVPSNLDEWYQKPEKRFYRPGQD